MDWKPLKHAPECKRQNPECLCMRCANDYIAAEGICCDDTRGKCPKKRCKRFKQEVMEDKE